MSSILNDLHEIRTYWLCVALIYTGKYDLVSIKFQGKQPVFTVCIPAFDLEAYESEYFAGSMLISSARDFGETAGLIGRLIKDAKRDGQWTNADYDRLIHESLQGE